MKQAKGDGRAAKGQHDHYGTCSWPMEKYMDHYAASRLVAASELEHGKLRLASSKVRGRLVAFMAWWRR
ncbi:hypothetical protein PR002_g28721 [Phytophthora rubi]|uniref:Uncharacterized protein n=1 Tax=Phytophthora rubi TaxID=129364 RepID=A0A6A3H8D2_9STRA|nr:hypothetical protein PR002_g28721 [Phytophthora rubi]